MSRIWVMWARLDERLPNYLSVSQGALENENPDGMSQGLTLRVVLALLMEYIMEEMMSDGILSAGDRSEMLPRRYLDNFHSY